LPFCGDLPENDPVIDLEFENPTLDSVLKKEWLETNGLGGYASSTVCGANTRRYHGLLVAAADPPVGRLVLLSKFEETVQIGDERYDLSTNLWPDAVEPKGFVFLREFRLDPFPIWTFKVGGVTLERTLFMPHGSNAVVVRWQIIGSSSTSDQAIQLSIRPLIAFRDFHHLRHQEADIGVEIDKGVAVISLSEMPSMYLSHNAGSAESTGHWYRNFQYPIEAERGFDHNEDLFQPFELKFALERPAVLIVGTEYFNVRYAERLRKAEIKRRARLVAVAGAKDEFTRQLVLAADQFIVKRGRGHSIIAGYHWFSDWGRDTMIALPGLTLATRRFALAREILLEYSRHVSEGMIPNRFPDEGEIPDYNTVDAALWYFEAVRAYAEASGDEKFVFDELYEVLLDIIYWHVKGTRFGIHVDTDGLLSAGEHGTQLTWMDAKFGETAFTPRIGKPVEIQALWFNALSIMAGFAEAVGDAESRKRFNEMASMAKASFNGQFWNSAEECLFDVVNGIGKDASIRPNQIFAVSLTHSMLDNEKARKVVEKVEKELLTPFGLRSLSPRHPNYKGVYKGGPFERDSSYHQGTVWAWLIGPFIDAYRRTHSNDAAAQRRIDQLIRGFDANVKDIIVGQISEIFDGDAPHLPRGCGAQAWSVGEILRSINKAAS
jgi:predicted glycogen debranching enzyme